MELISNFKGIFDKMQSLVDMISLSCDNKEVSQLERSLAHHAHTTLAHRASWYFCNARFSMHDLWLVQGMLMLSDDKH